MLPNGCPSPEGGGGGEGEQPRIRVQGLSDMKFFWVVFRTVHAIQEKSSHIELVTGYSSYMVDPVQAVVYM